MPVGLERTLTPHKAEVLQVVREFGIGEAMLQFGVKQPKSFKKWLTAHRDDLYSDNPIPVGISGGQKEKWLRTHRDTILDCLELFGRQYVLNRFNLKEDTLCGLEGRDGYYLPKNISRQERMEIQLRQDAIDIKTLFSELEKIRLELGMEREANKELRHDNEEVREGYAEFANTTARRVAESLIIPLMHALLQPNGKLASKKSSLTITDLLNQGKKYQLERHNPQPSPDNPLLETVNRVKEISGDPLLQTVATIDKLADEN